MKRAPFATCVAYAISKISSDEHEKGEKGTLTTVNTRKNTPTKSAKGTEECMIRDPAGAKCTPATL